MNRTQRLLNLLQILRGYRHPVNGQRLAERLNVSVRTLYRDIATLQAQGAEIVGEVGIGYVLKPTFFLPPLMFNQIEMESLLLGARWVIQYGDAPLSKAASDALNKIFDVLPNTIKHNVNAFALRVGPPATEPLSTENLSTLREAIALQQKIRFLYSPENGKAIQYTAWPFTIGYFTDGRILVAWCEKQKIFKHFKTNLINSLQILNEHYSPPKETLFREWQALQLKKYSPRKR